VTVSLGIATDHQRLPMNMEIALFRILQESLTNVAPKADRNLPLQRLLRKDSG
jgi:signal transduction histidine kinase